MAEYAFDFYAPDVDPDLVTRLVRMTVGDQLVDGEFRPVLTGYGSGFIEIHGDHPDVQYVAKRVLVQFVRTDVMPERKIGAFWLEEGQFDALTRQEQRGRILRFEGPGALYILDRHVLNHIPDVPDNPNRGSNNTPGKWTWENVPYGDILIRLIEEGKAHAHAPYAPIDIGFLRLQDSDGNTWDSIGDYQVDIGTSGSKILADFLKLGLIVQMDAELQLDAWASVDDFGTDRTSATYAAGKVRFQAGENIFSDLPKKIHGTQRRSFVLVRGRQGNYQTVDEDIFGNPLPSEPYGAFLKFDATNDTTAIVNAGKQYLTRAERQSDSCKIRHLIGPGGTSGADGYDPGPAGDYWVGDTVTVNTGIGEHDFQEQGLEVAAIRFYLHGGTWMAEAELGAQYLSPLEQQSTATASIVQSIIRDIGTPITLCEADILIPQSVSIVGQKVLQWPGGGANLTGSIADLADEGQDGDVWLFHGSIDVGNAGSHIPTAVSSATHIGAGGGAGGALSGVAQHGAWKLWDAADVSVTWQDTHYLMVFLLRGVLVSDPIGAIAGGSDASGDIDFTSLTLEVGDGSARVFAFAVHESEDIADNGMTGTPSMTALEEAMAGQHGAWVSADGISSWGAHAIPATNDDRVWTAYEIKAAEGSTTLRDGMEALVGTSTSLKRCDDTNVYEATGSDAPTVDDDRDAGFRLHTFWINEDGEAWLITDTTAGAAVWIQITAAGSGAPADATYLVGAAHAGLSAEIVVGATPGGELGGTWASPTVDATHSGSTHSAATDTHIADTTAAHVASSIGFTPHGSIAATDVQAAIQEVRDEAAGGGAPSTADFLVGTADGGLSNEIVVGTTPGGELGGTWASPTVDATHSGSAHADAIPKALVDAKGDLLVGTADNTVARQAIGTDGHVLTADSSLTNGLKWAAAAGGGSHSTATAFVTASTTINSATYIDITGASISLAAGTWLIVARIGGTAVNAAFLMIGAITDSSNNLVAEGAQNVPASGSASIQSWGSLTLTAIVTPGSTTSYKLRAAKGTAAPTANWTAEDDAPENQANNGSGKNSDKGTVILAIQLA